MADIVCCTYAWCPLKKCEKHPVNRRNLLKIMDGKERVFIGDYSGTCRKYLSYLLELSEKEKKNG